MAHLEHINITVADLDATAALFADLFGWHVRWEGASIYEGRSLHIGGQDTYVALYTGPTQPAENTDNSYQRRAALNHIGVVVDDLDAVEAKVKARGYQAYSHQDYEPGRRFYFEDENGLEIEVISYA